MSSTCQAVIFSDNLTGFGYLPDAIPDHHDERLTGIIGGMSAVLSPKICFSLKKPITGIFIVQPHTLLINWGYYNALIVDLNDTRRCEFTSGMPHANLSFWLG